MVQKQRRRFSTFSSMATCVMAVAVLAGCSSTAPAPKVGPLHFEQLGMVALEATNIEVVDQYRPPMTKPNVDHLAPTPPAQGLRQWATVHFHPAGLSGSVQIIIRDASIIEVQLPRTEGIKSVFTTDQAQRYDGRIEVRIVGQSPGTGFSGYIQATATRSISVPEDITLAGREATWNTMTSDMIDDISAQLDRGLRETLRPMLRR
jgi:hypothetical protein